MNEDVIPQHHKKERGEERTIERKEGKAWRRDEWKEGGRRKGRKEERRERKGMWSYSLSKTLSR